MVGRREGASEQHPGLIPGEELETYRTKSLTAKADTARRGARALKVAQAEPARLVRARADRRRHPDAHRRDRPVRERGLRDGDAARAGSDAPALPGRAAGGAAPQARDDGDVHDARDDSARSRRRSRSSRRAADPTTHMVGVTAEVDSESTEVLASPGLVLRRQRRHRRHRDDAAVIPRAATRATDHGYVVYVVEGDVGDREGRHARHEHQGRLGRGAQRALKAGELLVVRGAEALSNGAQVKASKVDSLDASAPETPLSCRRRTRRRRSTARRVRLGGRDGGRPAIGGRSPAAVNITDVSIKNPVFAWMLMASTILFGIVALTRIGISQYPGRRLSRTSPSRSRGPAPRRPPSSAQIVEPIEQAISQVEGVKSIASQARSGSARITATFDMSRDVDLALQDIQARVARRSDRFRRTCQRRHGLEVEPRRHARSYHWRLRAVLAADAGGRRALPGAGEPADRRRASVRSR